MSAFTWYKCPKPPQNGVRQEHSQAQTQKRSGGAKKKTKKMSKHLFHLKAVAHFSSLSTWYSQADPGLGPDSTGAIPRCQAEALHRRALAGCEAHLGANHPETLTSMNNLAILLEKQGKLAEAGLRSFVKRGGDLPGGSFSGAYFLCGQGLRPGFFLFDFPILVGLLSWA